MRQHPIPQNILDVEFKLFSKFSVKEFVYMALGIAVGSIFLFLLSTGKMPAIFAIPFFLFFAGIGLFFGLVKINDQKADTYLSNFIKAITSPTLRVWRSKKYGVAKENDTALENRINKSNSGSIIGDQNLVKSDNVDHVQDLFDQQTTVLSPQTSLPEDNTNKQNSVNAVNTTASPSSLVSTNTQDAVVSDNQTNNTLNATSNSVSITTTIPPVNSDTSTGGDIAKTVLATNNQNLSSDGNTPSNLLPSNNITSQTSDNIQVEQILDTQQKVEKVVIGRHNIREYGIIPDASLGYKKIPNSIALMLTDEEKNPIQKAVVIIKDKDKKIILVKVSGQSGEVISNKTFIPSNYYIEITHDNYTFPQIEFILEKGIFPAFKITGKSK